MARRLLTSSAENQTRPDLRDAAFKARQMIAKGFSTENDRERGAGSHQALRAALRTSPADFERRVAARPQTFIAGMTAGFERSIDLRPFTRRSSSYALRC